MANLERHATVRTNPAAHLVDRVLPQTPVRQWILSLPFSLRYRLAYDARLTRDVLRLFVRRVFASMRRRARLRWPIDVPLCGAVTFVQRFGGALNLNVHFHTLVLDGVYDPGDGMRFRPLPPPDDGEVARVRRIATGPRAGQAVLRFGDRVEIDHLPASRGERCASMGGVSVHANVAVPPRDRQRLERLCRYAARPPLAIERLSRLADGPSAEVSRLT